MKPLFFLFAFLFSIQLHAGFHPSHSHAMHHSHIVRSYTVTRGAHIGHSSSTTNNAIKQDREADFWTNVVIGCLLIFILVIAILMYRIDEKINL